MSEGPRNGSFFWAGVLGATVVTVGVLAHDASGDRTFAERQEAIIERYDPNSGVTITLEMDENRFIVAPALVPDTEADPEDEDCIVTIGPPASQAANVRNFILQQSREAEQLRLAFGQRIDLREGAVIRIDLDLFEQTEVISVDVTYDRRTYLRDAIYTGMEGFEGARSLFEILCLGR